MTNNRTGERLRAAFEKKRDSTQYNIDAAMRRPELSSAERADVAVAQERRQVLVSEHHNIVDPETATNGHPGSQRAAGCPYCYGPGRLGDYTPEGQPRPLWSPTLQGAIDVADAFYEALASEAPE